MNSRINQSRDLSSMKQFGIWIRGAGAPASATLVPGIEGAQGLVLLDLPATPTGWTHYSVDIDSLLAARDTAFRADWSAAGPFIVQLDIQGLGPARSSQELWFDSVTIGY
jgi:hypothetical protein